MWGAFFVDFTCRLFWALFCPSCRLFTASFSLLPAVLGSFLSSLPAVSKNAYAFRSKCIEFWKHGPLLQFFDTKLPLNVSIFGNRTNQAVPPETPVNYAKKYRQKTAAYNRLLLISSLPSEDGFCRFYPCRILSSFVEFCRLKLQ